MTSTNIIQSSRQGIQPGQNISLGGPAKLEKMVREACIVAKGYVESLGNEILNPGYSLEWSKGVSAQGFVELFKKKGIDLGDDFAPTGIQPDGGILSLVFQDGNDVSTRRVEHIMVTEAKFQGLDGNAIERWYKNYTMASMLARDIMIVTFAAGPGAAPGKIIQRTLNGVFLKAVLDSHGASIRKWNTLYNTGPSMFADPNGFTQTFLNETMIKALIMGIRIVQNR